MFERDDVVEDVPETCTVTHRRRRLSVPARPPPTLSGHATEVPRPYRSKLGRKCDRLAALVLCCLGLAAHETWRAHADHVSQ
jgi:hypothetical protein